MEDVGFATFSAGALVLLEGEAESFSDEGAFSFGIEATGAQETAVFAEDEALFVL